MNKLDNILITLPLSQTQQQKIMSAAPDSRLTWLPAEAVDAEGIAEFDAILGNVPVELLPAATKLKWNQLGGVGTEGYDQPGAMPAEAILTNASGAYGRAVAGQAFAMLWTLMKKLHLYRDHQHSGHWQPLGEVQSVEGKTALILGFGDIGQSCAAYLKPFGVHIIGVNIDGTAHPLADEMYTLDSLDMLIGQADIIMNSLPGTGATNRIIAGRQFQLMKPTAILLNVGRGMSVDLEALCTALEEQRIWGAGVDVLEIEPLPQDHRAWKLPGLLISPHVAGGFNLPYTLDQVVELTCQNLIAYQAGTEMKNRIRRS